MIRNTGSLRGRLLGTANQKLTSFTLQICVLLTVKLLIFWITVLFSITIQFALLVLYIYLVICNRTSTSLSKWEENVI